MLHELLLIGYGKQDILPDKELSKVYREDNTHIVSFESASELVKYLLISVNYSLIKDVDGVKRINTLNSETEINYSITVLINPQFESGADANTPLDGLPTDKLISFLNYRFLNLNLIILSSGLGDKRDIEESLVDLEAIEENLSTRLNRIKCWIGFESSKCKHSHLDSMVEYLNIPLPSDTDLTLFTDLTSSVNYDNLLDAKHSDDHYLNSLNSWDFNAFNFNLDELLQLGYLIFEQFITSTDASRNHLKSFLFFVRDNYRTGNPFHNFRHAIDVLQATNYFLQSLANSNFQINKLQSFSLLLASLGHDIGHPGITNMFLIDHQSPLSMKFEKESILEKFHKYQVKNILLPFLTHCVDSNYLLMDLSEHSNLDYLFDIINSSILATDMAKHDYFVQQIKKLSTDFTNFKLLSCVLIKCADISNVCRVLDTSCKWGLSLGEEFKQIGCLEKYFKEPSNELLADNLVANNFGKSIKDIDVNESIKLVKNLSDSQMFFINRFARDFFTSISETIPQLKFLTDTLSNNTNYWLSVTDSNRD